MVAFSRPRSCLDTPEKGPIMFASQKEDFKMKHAIFILILAFLLVSCATTKTPLPTDNIDELLGTWVNTAYDSAARYEAGKMVWKADGTASEYRKSTYDRSYVEPTWEIKEKWKTANGAIYLVIFVERYSGRTYHYSIRLSPDGSYFEYMIHIKEAPVEIDPNDPAYCIYYRQK